jgi:hypothetical protein
MFMCGNSLPALLINRWAWYKTGLLIRGNYATPLGRMVCAKCRVAECQAVSRQYAAVVLVLLACTSFAYRANG